MEKIMRDHGVEDGDHDWMTYLSTHPEPYERIAKFRSENESTKD
jgi:Zn-dependent protease with chaperone function